MVKEILSWTVGGIINVLKRVFAVVSKKIVEEESIKLKVEIRDLRILQKEKKQHPTFGYISLLCENYSSIAFDINRIAIYLSVMGSNMPRRDRKSDYPILKVSEDRNILNHENMGHIKATSTKIYPINSKGDNFINILIEFEIPPWINIDDIGTFYLDGFIEVQKGVLKFFHLTRNKGGIRIG